MTNRPTVSVIIPVYNAARYLPEALDSLLRQTYPASQIIVVDDGSTDDTPEVLHRYRDSVLAIRQENAGEGAARNQALQIATGTYVALLDADDVCAPLRFERQVKALEDTADAVACFSGYWRFDETGRLSEHSAFDPRSDADSLDFLSRCQYMIISMMFDRARATGLRFPERGEHKQTAGPDIIFSALLATRGRMIAVPDVLYGYRMHAGQKSIKNRADSKSNFFFEYRYEWAQTHWKEYWPGHSWEDIERKLWEGLVGQTEDAYWARHKQFFLNDRKYLREKWPSNLPPPGVLRWRWYPDWLWTAKGYFDRSFRSKPAGSHSKVHLETPAPPVTLRDSVKTEGVASVRINRPTISVIVPAYNAGSFLGEALESLLKQTYRASQIIVVDDGSTDETPQILRAYRDNVLAIRQENAGEGATRNRGLQEATGTYVAFLDADDVCAPERFEQQVNALARTPEAVACFSGYWRFDANGLLGEHPASDPRPDTDPLDFLSRCQYHIISVMFDRARAAGLRFPDEKHGSGEDIIFSALLATRGRVITVPDPLYGYRSHPEQKSITNRTTSTSNFFFEYRYKWARAHWREHWPERSWEEIERRLWDGLVAQTEDAYWSRCKQFFLNDRNYLRRHWPSHLPSPDVLRWHWYSDWVWRTKDQFDSRIRSKPAHSQSTDALHRLNQEGK